MPTILIEDFKIGLDQRRLNDTSLPGSLVKCENAHITRGGEIEKSEAFIRFANLPANTFGLEAVGDGFMVFGSDNITPTVLNSNPTVRYQRLNDAGGVQSWGDFTIFGQVVSDTFTSILVDATELLAATTTCPAAVDVWPDDIAQAINDNSAVSGFSAYATGSTIIVYANVVGTANNGDTWTFSTTGTVTVPSNTPFSAGEAASNPSMIEVLSVALFDGKPYVVAEYDDGIIRHWWDGVKVVQMKSGKGRAKFTLSADPLIVSAISAVGSFTISTTADADTVTSITVDVVELLASTVVYDADSDEDGFEVKIVDAINDNTSTSGFSASLIAGSKVVITAEIPGTAVNGDAVAVAKTGSITISDLTAMAGGVAAEQITSVKINAVELLSTSVDWSESDQQTAIAVASTINENSSTNNYEAFPIGSTILLRSTIEGTAPNGGVLTTVADSNITISSASPTVVGGSPVLTVVEPGRFVKTFKNKMYALTGPSVYYSAIANPIDYTIGAGSGFDNLSTNTSGDEELLSIANYFDNMAIFSRNNIQLWFMDDDPSLNSQIQVLNNTGTIAPRSVVEFGDNDVFYLSENGINSIRARDTTNAAFVNDVGIAIDSIIQKVILENNREAEKAHGILEPRQGRFMLVIDEIFYVFSFFPSSKISAWSTYLPGFKVTDMASIGQTIVCRSTNALYKIGSTTQRVYDAKQAKIMTPFLYGSDPAISKMFTGFDMSCKGTWDVYVATDPLRVDENGDPDEEHFTRIGTVTDSTYAETGGENGHAAFDEMSTHISLMFISKNPVDSRIGNVSIHYAGGGGSKQ